jgi:hypothetical protein
LDDSVAAGIALRDRNSGSAVADGITDQQAIGTITRWQSQEGPYVVERLAGQIPTGDLLVFWWSPRADWQFVNVSAITKQKIASPVTSWQTEDGP